MKKILLINPSKMGSGYTPIWIASHSALLKEAGHEVKLFDACLYSGWSDQYTQLNTENEMFQPSDYSYYVKPNQNNIIDDLSALVAEYKPDVIFWSAVSSHIHSEGEYVNIQYGHDLLENIHTDALKVTGGIQATARPKLISELFPNIDYLILGESEFVVKELLEKIENNESVEDIRGLAFKKNGQLKINPAQDIISDLDTIPRYDYSIFSEQVLYRPYNGSVYKTVDYEFSRGCPFSCDYCVETVIQKYYGFNDKLKNGTVKNVKNYLRNKSSDRIFEELKYLREELGVKYIRCQDTHFLAIRRNVLKEVAAKLKESKLDVFLYIETRPDSIVSKDVTDLLNDLNVDGIGMGLESAIEEFREGNLNRFSKQEQIIKAFKLLKEAGIKRTSYNIIGLPGETEEMLQSTIKFNQALQPDNVSTSFYSAYMGTPQYERELKGEDPAKSYQYNLDDGIRCSFESNHIAKDKLEFYRKYYTHFVQNGFDKLPELAASEGVS